MIENTQTDVTSAEQLPIKISDDSIAEVLISVYENELTQYKKQYIKEKRKYTVIRGFRKGTAPEEMIAKYFGDEARVAARDNAIYTKYIKLLQEHRLKPLSGPKINNIHDQDGKIMASILVEVLQPIVLGAYLGIELQKMPQRTIEEGLAKTIAEVKDLYPKLTALHDATVQSGNVVVVDFTMANDGNEYEKRQDFQMSIGSNLYFNGFEENIIGMKDGETKEFDVFFPDTYSRDELKNKNIHFILSVKKIQDVSKYTEDELSKILGYENKDVMIVALTKEIEEKYKDEEHLFYENQLLGQLLTAHQFKLPKKLLDEEIEKILKERKELSVQQAEEIAERFVKTDLILGAIYERHPEIQFKQEEFNVKINELAVKANDTAENIIKRLNDTGKLKSYVDYLTHCKVIDFLIDMSDKKNVSTEVIVNDDNTVQIVKEQENG